MRKLQLSILFLFFLCVTASAHDYWITPDSFHPHENSFINAALSSGHSYFGDVEVPDITRFQLNLLTPDGRQIPLAYSGMNHEAARATVPILGSGTYVISSASSKPSYWSKTKNGSVPGPRSMVKDAIQGGKYVKSVKTFLTVGSGSDTYKKVLGYKIEIVPQANPTTLKPGQTLPLLVLYNDNPLPDATVFGVFEGYKLKEKKSYPIETKTDANGIARISMNRTGKWLVGAKYQFNSPKNPDADYENYRAYIMFNID